jgi:hypothetical protein
MGTGTGFEGEGAAIPSCALQKADVCFPFKTARQFTSARNANQARTEWYSSGKNKQNRLFALIQA